jgi:uncharacterized protein with PIN domain
MPDIMKMGKNPNYLGSWDLEELPNREITLTIERIVDEDVVANNREEKCTVCYWKEANYKPMILNVTNKKMIAKLYHTKDTDKLAGKAVVIGVSEVKAFGDVHDALRIRKRIPKVAEAAEKCADCGGEVKGAMGKSAAYIVSYTKKQFDGTCLCFDCAMKRKEKAENGNAD